MGCRNSANRYGSLSIGMHWLMLLLLMVAVYAMINLHDLAPKGSDLRAAFKVWHFALGIGVFGLVLPRPEVRVYAGTAPRITPPISQWQKYSAVAVRIALYLFMLGMPLLGWFRPGCL